MVNIRDYLCNKQENSSKKSAVINQEQVIMAHEQYTLLKIFACLFICSCGRLFMKKTALVVSAIQLPTDICPIVVQNYIGEQKIRMLI